MVMGGAMIIAGQESDPRPLAARESIGVFGGDCFEIDPNHAVIGAGGAAAGAGRMMILVRRNKPVPRLR
jgi:hypothetical protein